MSFTSVPEFLAPDGLDPIQSGFIVFSTGASDQKRKALHFPKFWDALQHVFTNLKNASLTWNGTLSNSHDVNLEMVPTCRDHDGNMWSHENSCSPFKKATSCSWKKLSRRIEECRCCEEKGSNRNCSHQCVPELMRFHQSAFGTHEFELMMLPIWLNRWGIPFLVL